MIGTEFRAERVVQKSSSYALNGEQLSMSEKEKKILHSMGRVWFSGVAWLLSRGVWLQAPRPIHTDRTPEPD